MARKKNKKGESTRPEPLHVIRRKPSPPSPPLPPRVISPDQLKQGLEEKKRELQGITDEITQFFRICPGVKAVEVPFAFNGEGKFIGVGTGGVITLKITVQVER
ncbi:MAG: hypothetical protein N2572_02040 [Syntrophales bacterium]|nr:hypothetical protein [Syntrophales bacterium]